ncbi:unnamed protein product [Protopolystoma xenopodis]|uniref:Uncharacterized protein n=1 Tax=Protopolystoma xenopodis TaxID=117903 RepID=A0A448X538_9PLAT|nr:unnamed protein product [Protopolystoma xenopodis]
MDLLADDGGLESGQQIKRGGGKASTRCDDTTKLPIELDPPCPKSSAIVVIDVPCVGQWTWYIPRSLAGIVSESCHALFCPGPSVYSPPNPPQPYRNTC